MATAESQSATTFGLRRIGQVALTVDDLERAVAFYRDILGMRLLFQAPPGLAFFDCGEVRLMLSRPEGESESRASSMLYYVVDDIQAAHDILRGRGVTFDDTPHLIAALEDHDLWMTFFRDSEGNIVGLMSEVARARQAR